MKSIESRLQAIEKHRIKERWGKREYCTKHPRDIVIVFDKDNPPEIPSICPQCGKPYPPEIPPVIVDFAAMGITEDWG